MNLSHKIRLYPTDSQQDMLARAAGCARFTYNWCLENWQKQYKEGKKPNANNLKKQFNSIKKEQFPWILESPKDANQQAFADVNKAYKAFFERRSKYPKFKKRGKNRDSFYVSNDKFSFCSLNSVKLPVIGKVRLAEPLRFTGKILSGRVTRQADAWYLSVSVEGDFKKDLPKRYSVVGLDLGLKTAIVLSDGTAYEAPKPLKAALGKLKRAQQSLSRKQKGSNNRLKQRNKVAKVYATISSIRKDWIQKITSIIAKNHGVVVLEDLNVKGMLQNHKLARAISDVGFYEIRRCLEYKQAIYGHKVVVVDRYFASSKLCSSCGNKKESLGLSERIYACTKCGLTIDRDLNAAKNLEQYAKTYPRLEGNSAKTAQKPVENKASTRSTSKRSCKLVQGSRNPTRREAHSSDPLRSLER